MKLDQYLFNKKQKREDFAKQCGVTTRAVQHAIAKDYIIVGNTVYSPRFKIQEQEND